MLVPQVPARTSGERGVPRLLLYPTVPACPLLPERPRHLRQVQGEGGRLSHLQDPHD